MALARQVRVALEDEVPLMVQEVASSFGAIEVLVRSVLVRQDDGSLHTFTVA